MGRAACGCGGRRAGTAVQCLTPPYPPPRCRVDVVSAAFEGKNSVARHRLIYGLLQEELAAPGGVHALALKTKTPAEAGGA